MRLRRLFAAQLAVSVYLWTRLFAEWNATTGTKASKASNPPWSNAAKQKSTDEVTFSSTNTGEMLIESLFECKSFDANGFKGELSFQAETQIFGASSGNVALRIPSSLAGIVGDSPIVLKGTQTSPAMQISLATFAPSYTFALKITGTGTYKLETSLPMTGGSNASLLIEAGKLEANGHTIEAPILEVSSGAALDITSSTVKVTSGLASKFSVNAGATVTSTGSTIEFTGTGATQMVFAGGGHTYNIVAFPNNVVVEGSNTIATTKVFNKSKPLACKATWTTLTNHLVVTEGEANLAVGVEVVNLAKGIPVGTTIIKKIEAGVWELSATPSGEAAIAAEVTIYQRGLVLTGGSEQTVTTLECNGSGTEPNRICSSKAGEQAKVKGVAGNHEITATVRIKDLAFTAGDYYFPNGVNLGGNNEHVHFESEPAGGVTIPLAAASSTSSAALALAALTAITPATAAASSAASFEETATTTLTPATAPSASTASLAASAATLLGTATATSSSTDTLAISATTLLAPATATAASSVALSVNAVTTVALAGSTASSGASLALLNGGVTIPLGTAAAASTGALALKAQTLLAPTAAAASSGAQVTLNATTPLALATATAGSSSSLAMSATATIGLSTATAASTAALTVVTYAAVGMVPAQALSTATLALTVHPSLILHSASTSGASLTIQASGVFVLVFAGAEDRLLYPSGARERTLYCTGSDDRLLTPSGGGSV